MKNLFTNKVKVILVVAVIAALVTVGSMLILSGRASPMNNYITAAMNPLKNGVSLLVERAERYYDYMFSYEALQAENDYLREEMADMNQDIREAQSYTQENERLRELLGLAQEYTTFEYEIADVVSWSGDGYGRTLSVSKGSASGVEAGMCAITESGQVVGLVTEAGTNWSTITTILDTSSEIGSYIFGSGYTCIAQGDLELMRDGQLQASYIVSNATIRNGDQVLTSGDGDIYPADLTIGTVVDVGNDDINVAKYATVEPTVDISSLDQIFIIKSFSTNES